jgi:HSP20 family protein
MMELKKLAPWNWFKKEEEATGAALPVRRSGQALPERRYYSPLGQLHQEMDQLFDQFFNGVGPRPAHAGGLFRKSLSDGLLKPTLDIGATHKEYAISVEIPGVDQKDIKLEIVDNTLTISGEKKQEKEEKEKGYYRVERAYGSFKRVLSLPEDADQDAIKAKFKKGVLNITLPKKTAAATETKQIEIK